jgi:TraM recognition site of TraD and TraG
VLLRKIFDDNTDSNAYRIERILRNAIHTAFSVEGATLFTVLRLLTDASYRKKITRDLKDESLKRFWKEELGKAGEMQRVKISGGPISRIERFERSEAAKRILGQTKSTIDFDDIMNSSKILICNFSKGGLGEDTSVLFGTTVLAKLQLAAWRRDEISESKRVPFYLYVDEFQDFASDSFLSLFSEARKYKLFITMAQQSMSQLKDQDMYNTVLDNVGTIICFRSKSLATEQLMLHQFSPHIDQGDIGNLPSFNFYIKIAALSPQEPLSGETLLLHGTGSEGTRKSAIKASRKNYSVPYQSGTADDATTQTDTTSNKANKNDQTNTVKQEPEAALNDADDLGDDLPQLDGSSAEV